MIGSTNGRFCRESFKKLLCSYWFYCSNSPQIQYIFIPTDEEISTACRCTCNEIIIFRVADQPRHIVRYIYQFAQRGDQSNEAHTSFIVEVALELGILEHTVEFLQ